jgi:paraquat-inducible protein B
MSDKSDQHTDSSFNAGPESAGSSDAVPPNEQSNVVEAAGSFPVAEIRGAKNSTAAIVRQSKMWWLTLACLIIAFALTWKSIPSKGPTITIRFPDGHGLKAGDPVRYRGIEAGVVDSIALSEDLTQINATVTLTAGATGLAREGSRFWIVRPQLSLAGVSGLETAVGAKYIAVSPGDPTGTRRSRFEGLSSAPPDENGGEGIDVVLRGESRHGIAPGAPVGWRGVDVGQILSVNLSPDARHVDIHARIDAEFSRLLRPTSVFWVTSGLGVDVGLSGIRLNADSISTIVRGGVSFATPSVTADEAPVTSGQMFILHRQAEPAWLEAGSSLPFIKFPLPPTITLQGTRPGSLLGFSRRQSFTAHGVLFADHNGGPMILTAADVVPHGPSPSGDESKPVELQASSVTSESSVHITWKADPTQNGPTTTASGFVWIPCDSTMLPSVKSASLRAPTVPEECCLCRSVKTDQTVSSVIQTIAQNQLQNGETHWTVTADAGDLSSWHGAPVVSMQDGKVIGVFVASDSGAMIAPYRE